MTQRPLIACVDDDMSVREALSGLLRVVGFAVEVFVSAEDFLEAGRFERFFCLITDIKLGGMSGLELQKHLSAAGYRIPTIVITAFEEARLRDQAMDAGAVGFLRKPIVTGDLLSCIESSLDRELGGK